VSKRWRIVGSVALLGVVAWRLDWSALHHAFLGLDLRFWMVAVAIYAVAQGVSSLRWQMLAAPLGFTVSWWSYLSFYSIGMFFNLLLPTSVGGDVVRALYLAADQKRDSGRAGNRNAKPPGRAEAVLSVLTERASGLGVLVALACLAGLAAPVPPWMAGILIALAAGLVLGIASLPFLHLLARLPVLGRRLGLVVEAGGVYFHRPGLLAWTTLLSIFVQVANVVLVWCIGQGLGLGVSLGYMTVVVPLMTLLTLLPVSVNGMGLREVALVVLLGPVGVAPAAAVTLSLLTFAVYAALGLAGAGVYLFGRYPRLVGASSDDIQGPEKGQSHAQPVGGGADQGRTRQPKTAA
jgi:uncharacterized membrane protein YbhN (UPF0104 family)